MTSIAASRSRRFRRARSANNIAAVLGCGLVGLFIAVGLVSIVWTPYNAEFVDVSSRLVGPSLAHPFGTDQLGRDILSQVMVGAQNTLLVGVIATAASLVPGLILGLVAAGYWSWLDQVILRLSDIALALPAILVALILATVIGPGNATAIAAIAAWFIPTVARVIRAPAKQILTKDFVVAAHAYGRPQRFILWRHVLPNLASIVIVQASMMFALAILVEAALAYLGVGAQRPTPSWGRMLNESQAFAAQAPYMAIFPGVAIMLAVLGFNLLGDALRTFTDPRLSREVTK